MEIFNQQQEYHKVKLVSLNLQIFKIDWYKEKVLKNKETFFQKIIEHKLVHSYILKINKA
jgi:hypothetical protein